jgi:hypothetical protein
MMKDSIDKVKKANVDLREIFTFNTWSINILHVKHRPLWCPHLLQMLIPTPTLGCFKTVFFSLG